MLSHTQHRILTPPPHTLHIDLHRQIPDAFLSANRIGVICMHDASIIEHDVDASPGVEMGDCSRDVGFAADVAREGFEAGGEGGEDRTDFGDGRVQEGGGDVGHEN